MLDLTIAASLLVPAAPMLARTETGDGMRILVVHNRYRSASPSGENRVVDQETKALVAAGHEVEHFERLSDDIEDFSLRQKAAHPRAGRLEPERRPRDRPGARQLQAGRRPRSQPLPDDQPVGVARLPAAPRARGGDTSQLPADLPERGPFPRRQDLPRLRRPGPAARRCDMVVTGIRLLPPSRSPLPPCAQKRTWQTLPSAYIFISAAQRRSLLEPRSSAPSAASSSTTSSTRWSAELAKRALDRLHRPAQRGQGPSAC